MPSQSLEDRVSALERAVSQLSKLIPGEKPSREKDWRNTLGMFAGDSVTQEIIDEGRSIREQDRQQVSE